MIVQFRHRADRGAGCPYGVRLINRDRGRHAVNPIDMRPVHAVEELARVGAQCLDIAALALGVERIEDQRTLAGT